MRTIKPFGYMLTVGCDYIEQSHKMLELWFENVGLKSMPVNARPTSTMICIHLKYLTRTLRGQMKSAININLALTVYKTLARPIITYAAPAWGCAPISGKS
jgi:hypothetical protein